MSLPTTLRRRALLAAAAAALLAGALAPGAQAGEAGEGAPAGGTLVLVGGGLKADNDEVYEEIVGRAGGERARIGVLTAASVPASQDPDADDPEKCSNSECNGRYYAGLLREHGAGSAEWIPVDLDHVSNADSAELARRVRSMSGFFLGGGDQYRYVTTLLRGRAHRDSPVLAAIRDRFAEGAVVAGTSAGAQITAGPDMVTGGESYEGLRDGSAPGYFDDATKLGYLPAGGFGFLRSGLLDTHTGAYGREGRAVRLAADTGHARVFGLEENTALVVEGAGTARERMRVVGERGVAVLDLRDARTPGPRSVRGVRYTYLTGGDSYDPRRWRSRPGPGKEVLRPRSAEPVPANGDVFFSRAGDAGTPYSFLGTARALAGTSAQRTAVATTYEDGPRFAVTFRKGPGFGAWTAAGGTGAHTLRDLRIDIAPQ